MTTEAAADQDLQTVLEVLTSQTSRTILEALSEQPMSASEISDEFDIPRSTVYRKLDDLVEVSLVEQSERLRGDGHHESLYQRKEEIVLGVVADQSSVKLRRFASGPETSNGEL
ncbi:winged helix-turn-helix domain-containing protein [Haloarculaceae archaeon H-GB2-1]|nr:winged helix-turn-helix domain-containing protein [Haloarculaceae archaeon H-GB11]MEA5409952.1 winged helix-turn-helix domain-containing protein [Haloarculaceae archaeon H-GB2-1]